MLESPHIPNSKGNGIATVCSINPRGWNALASFNNARDSEANMTKKELYHNIFCEGLYNLIYDKTEATYNVDETLNFQTDLNELIANYEWLIKEIDSPIEKIMGAALFFTTDGYNRLIFSDSESFIEENRKLAEIDPKHWGTSFASQVKIDKYKVDFLLATVCMGRVFFTAIECDGHDYHERTKQQASRDKKRDRFLIGKNIPTLRFTGSDLYNNSEECLEEITDYLCNQIDKLLVDAGEIRGCNGKN